MALKIIKGKLDASGQKFGIVVSRFNHYLTDKLVEGAIDCLERHGTAESDITVCHVPGAFEIPHTAAKLVKSNNFDAVVCLGVIIRGETSHFDYVAGESASGIAKLSLESDIPVLYGIVTTENLEQAIDRCGAKAGNKGWDAALAAIEMINLDKQI